MGCNILPANCSLAAPSAVNISILCRMHSWTFGFVLIFCLILLMPGCLFPRVQNLATALCTALTTSTDVAPASRINARQPTRTSRFLFEAEYLIRSRPLRSSNMMLTDSASAMNPSSSSLQASYRHHCIEQCLRSFVPPLTVLISCQVVLNSSTLGAPWSNGVPLLP